MIHKQQLDKILNFIDAGIIIPQSAYLDSIKSLEAIINFEDYSINIIYGTTLDNYNKIKLSQNLENDILTMNNILSELNEQESKRIGKNSFTFNWELEILDYEILIEDITIMKIENSILNEESNKVFKKEEVENLELEEYLNQSFSKLTTELNSPTKLLSSNLFDYQQEFNNITLNSSAYNTLIKNSNIRISYKIDLTIVKNIKEVI